MTQIRGNSVLRGPLGKSVAKLEWRHLQPSHERLLLKSGWWIARAFREGFGKLKGSACPSMWSGGNAARGVRPEPHRQVKLLPRGIDSHKSRTQHQKTRGLLIKVPARFDQVSTMILCRLDFIYSSSMRFMYINPVVHPAIHQFC